MESIDKVVTEVKQDLTWLQKHATLVMVVCGLAVLLVLGNKYLNVSAENNKINAAVLQQKLDAQIEANAKQAELVKQTQDQYIALTEQLTRQNQALVTAMSRREVDLKNQQQNNMTASLPDLAKRWQGLANLDASDLKVTTNGVEVSDLGSRKTVNELERIGPLEADKKDQQQIIGNKDQQLGKANSLIAELGIQVNGLNSQITDQKNVCEAEKKSIKAEAIKGKRNWFLGGLATGAVLVAKFFVF